MEFLKVRMLKLYIGLAISVFGANFIVKNLNECGFSQNIVKAMEVEENDEKDNSLAFEFKTPFTGKQKSIGINSLDKCEIFVSEQVNGKNVLIPNIFFTCYDGDCFLVHEGVIEEFEKEFRENFGFIISGIEKSKDNCTVVFDTRRGFLCFKEIVFKIKDLARKIVYDYKVKSLGDLKKLGNNKGAELYGEIKKLCDGMSKSNDFSVKLESYLTRGFSEEFIFFNYCIPMLIRYYRQWASSLMIMKLFIEEKCKNFVNEYSNKPSEEDSKKESLVDPQIDCISNVRVPTSMYIKNFSEDEYFKADLDYFEDKNGDFLKSNGIIYPNEKTIGGRRCYKKGFLAEIILCLESNNFLKNSDFNEIIKKLRNLQYNESDTANVRNIQLKKYILKGKFDPNFLMLAYTGIASDTRDCLELRSELLEFLDRVKDKEECKSIIPFHGNGADKNITVLQAIEILEEHLRNFVWFRSAECAYISQKLNLPFDYFLVRPEIYIINEKNLQVYENDSELKEAYNKVEEDYRYSLGPRSNKMERTSGYYFMDDNYFNSCEMFTGESYGLDKHRGVVNKYIDSLRRSKDANKDCNYKNFCDAMVAYNKKYCEILKEFSSFSLNIEKNSFDLCSNIIKKFFEDFLDDEELRKIDLEEEKEIARIKRKIDSDEINGNLVNNENYCRESNLPMRIGAAHIDIEKRTWFKNIMSSSDVEFDEYFGYIKNMVKNTTDGIYHLTQYINSGELKKVFKEQYYDKLNSECLEKFNIVSKDINISSMSSEFSSLLESNVKIIKERVAAVYTSLCNALYKNTIVRFAQFLDSVFGNLLRSLLGCRIKFINNEANRPDEIFCKVHNFIGGLNGDYTNQFVMPIFKQLRDFKGAFAGKIVNRFKFLLYDACPSYDYIKEYKKVLEDSAKNVDVENGDKVNLNYLFQEVFDVFGEYLNNYDNHSKKFEDVCSDLDGCSKGLEDFIVNVSDALGIQLGMVKKIECLKGILDSVEKAESYVMSGKNSFPSHNFRSYLAVLMELAKLKKDSKGFFIAPTTLAKYFKVNLRDYWCNTNN